MREDARKQQEATGAGNCVVGGMAFVDNAEDGVDTIAGDSEVEVGRSIAVRDEDSHRVSEGACAGSDNRAADDAVDTGAAQAGHEDPPACYSSWPAGSVLPCQRCCSRGEAAHSLERHLICDVDGWRLARVCNGKMSLVLLRQSEAVGIESVECL